MGCGSSNANNSIRFNIENQSTDLQKGKQTIKEALKKKSTFKLEGNKPSENAEIMNNQNSKYNELNQLDSKSIKSEIMNESSILSKPETLKSKLKPTKSLLNESEKVKLMTSVITNKTVSFSDTLKNEELSEHRYYNEFINLKGSQPNTIANAGKILCKTDDFSNLNIMSAINSNQFSTIKKSKTKAYKIYYRFLRNLKKLFTRGLKLFTLRKIFLFSRTKPPKPIVFHRIMKLKKSVFSFLINSVINKFNKQFIVKFDVYKYNKYLKKNMELISFDNENKCKFHKDEEITKYTPKIKNNNIDTQNINILGKYLYSMEDKIGHGQSAKVYKVKDKSPKNHEQSVKSTKAKDIDDSPINGYAVKEIYKKNVKSSYESEFRAYDKINCFDFIVKVYDIKEEKLKCYIVMEYMKYNLKTLLEKDKGSIVTNDTFIRRFLRSLIYALEYLHEEVGIVHLDIHPKNILLSEDLSKIKLTDFGSSKSLENLNDSLPNKSINTSTTLTNIKSLCEGDYEKETFLKDNYSPSSFQSTNTLIHISLYKAPHQLNFTKLEFNDEFKNDSYKKYFINNDESDEFNIADYYKSLDIWMLGITIYYMLNKQKTEDFTTLIIKENYKIHQ